MFLNLAEKNRASGWHFFKSMEFEPLSKNVQGRILDLCEKYSEIVFDNNNNRIQKFTSDGTFITAWGSEGEDNGQFYEPKGIAIDSSDHVYVVDPGNHRIQVFAPTI
jgi:hypothetical protein